MGHGELIDFRLVDLCVFERSAASHINDLDLTRLGGDVERLVEGTPDCTCEFLLILRHDFLDRFWSVIDGSSLDDLCQIVYADIGHPLVHVDEEELLVTKAKADLDLSVARYDNRSSTSAILHIEHNNTFDGGGEDILGVLGHVEASACRLHIELAHSDALIGIIHGDLAIIGAREQQVSVLVVEHLAHGT